MMTSSAIPERSFTARYTSRRRLASLLCHSLVTAKNASVASVRPMVSPENLHQGCSGDKIHLILQQQTLLDHIQQLREDNAAFPRVDWSLVESTSLNR